MSKLLLVSYAFPPCGGVGVQRALSYARYLPEYGVEVTVLTAGNAATAFKDPSLVASIPSNVRLEKTFTPEIPYSWRQKIWERTGPATSQKAQNSDTAPKSSAGLSSTLRKFLQRLATPDPQVVWVPFAIRRGAELVRKHKIDTVLVTAPPFSSLRVGVELKKRFPGLRLISEFRDEWLGYYIHSDRGADEEKRRFAAAFERGVVEQSDHVVSVTDSWLERLRKRYPHVPSDRFLLIENGYDPDVFWNFQPRPHGQRKMLVTYTGTIYVNPVYSPKPYVEALDALPADIRDQIFTRFIGRIADGQESLLQRPDMEMLGFLPHRQAMDKLAETDWLLLIVNDPTAHAGKLFEYLATRKPILALTPAGGEIARLIERTNSGISADPADPVSLHRALLKMHEGWKNCDAARQWGDDAAVRQYSRVELIGRLTRATGIGGA